MALNIDRIRNAFQSGDFARPNLFEVEIPLLGRDFSVKCRGASLPAAVTEPIEVSYQNRKIKIAGDRSVEEWTVTVYNSDDHAIRKQFLDWQSQCAAMGKSIFGETPDVYKQNALVRQFDRKGEETAVYNMYGIWPTNVGEIALDWESNNEVETFEVTFAVDFWTSGDGLNA